jgi:hypothetical protein
MLQNLADVYPKIKKNSFSLITSVVAVIIGTKKYHAIQNQICRKFKGFITQKTVILQVFFNGFLIMDKLIICI